MMTHPVTSVHVPVVAVMMKVSKYVYNIILR